MSSIKINIFNIRLALIISLSVLLGLITFIANPIARAENPDALKPSQSYVVNDYANILSDSSQQHIIDQAKRFQATKSQPQVVVITVNNTDGMDMKSFTNELTLRQVWQAGKKGQDNGVLIVFAKNNGQNNVRVATGTGVESSLPDGKISQLLNENRSQLKSSDNTQINQGLMKLFDEVCQNIPTDGQAKASSKATKGLSLGWILLLVILFPLLSIFLINKLMRRNKNYASNGHSSVSGQSSWWQWLLLGSLLNSDSGNRHDSWSDSDSNGFGGGDNFTDSGGGGDFGGGGSDF
ncbi:TPM domain-containing protein [Convivina intestini]|uniref:TPM domain-containing protein n=1 Tax=Convivina intestini TaxID=1505726 RepID=A0A2U1DBH4_9LACO|nr:TPM domain-containing protein [Convivina intestini]PVY85006.1 uncharacterized protein C7384_10325 [Convivina intestini]CAH1853380.1 hypothetical protein R077811_00679 [Convivina intestini]SDB89438.1 uncharacterized protein SAMN05216341_103129 [Leuconostocaceae bacterium R-53105]